MTFLPKAGRWLLANLPYLLIIAVTAVGTSYVQNLRHSNELLRRDKIALETQIRGLRIDTTVKARAIREMQRDVATIEAGDGRLPTLEELKKRKQTR